MLIKICIRLYFERHFAAKNVFGRQVDEYSTARRLTADLSFYSGR